MVDTAQPATAAETVAAPEIDPIQAAAQAFRNYDTAPDEQTERLRDDKGRFTSPGAEEGDGEEIEATDEADEAEAGAESREAGEETDEAAEEAQPEAVDLPNSWPAEHAETWRTLPPETQRLIAEREGQRDVAVNAKFQEAANLRAAHAAEIEEAKANRTRYAEAIDQVTSLIQPRWPSATMLDVHSSDYDPDTYHLMRAQAEQQQGYIQQLADQRKQLSAQAQQEAERAQQEQFNALNSVSRDAFLKDVPDAADQAKAPTVFQGLIEYAVKMGAPVETFQTPTTALEWHVLWKAQKYDELQKAKAKVASDPKPEPRKAQPVVRAGVTTPRSAIEKQRAGAAMQRLASEGTVEAGAAALKHLLKGKF